MACARPGDAAVIIGLAMQRQSTDGLNLRVPVTKTLPDSGCDMVVSRVQKLKCADLFALLKKSEFVACRYILTCGLQTSAFKLVQRTFLGSLR